MELSIEWKIWAMKREHTHSTQQAYTTSSKNNVYKIKNNAFDHIEYFLDSRSVRVLEFLIEAYFFLSFSFSASSF